MLKSLMVSPIAWAILSACTIASFVFAITSRRKKKLSVFKTSYQIVKEGNYSIGKLKLLFDNKEIDSLSISKFTIWNSGNEVIQKADLVSERPLCIVSRDLENSAILDASIVLQNEPTNHFEATVDSNKVEVGFDYADKKQGVVVQVVHSGSASDLYVDCKIKGGKLSQEKLQKAPKKGKKKKHIKLGIVLTAIEAIAYSSTFCLCAIAWIVDSGDVLTKAIISLYLLGSFPVFAFDVYSEFNLSVPADLRKNIYIEESTDA